MEGTIVIQEPRSVIDKFAAWYREKLIETGKSANFEERVDKTVDVVTKVVYSVGTVATVVLGICPLDGPFGEIIAIAATPLLAKLVEQGGKIFKKVVIGEVKRNLIEGHIVGQDGSSKAVVLPDGDVVEDAKNLGESIRAFGDDINARRGRKL